MRLAKVTGTPGRPSGRLAAAVDGLANTANVRAEIASVPNAPAVNRPAARAITCPSPQPPVVEERRGTLLPELTNHGPGRSAHRTISAFETDIRRRMKTWSKGPTTRSAADTAGEMLEPLAAARPRRNGSGRTPDGR